jgi:FMN phosphatase YigB (HAD superfamily)
MRPLSKYDLFIFDWDHTLTTSTLVVTILDMLRRYGRRGGADRIRSTRSSKFSAEGIVIRERTSKLYSLLDDAYALAFNPKLKPGATDTLDFLRSKGKKVAIFSDSKAYRLLKEIRNLGIDSRVDFALAAESIDSYKPDPTGLLLLIDRFGASKKRSVYIGDLPTDIMAARLAGIDAYAVADGIGSLRSLRNEKPDRLFPKLTSLLKALKSS